MYTQIWNKYLPIIRILIKKSVAAEQTFNMNATDFERAGIGRKSGYKFNIQFSNGKVDNVISSSVLAKDLTTTLLDDNVIRDLFKQNDYHISMNAKYQLIIKFIPKVTSPDQAVITPEPLEAV